MPSTPRNSQRANKADGSDTLSEEAWVAEQVAQHRSLVTEADARRFLAARKGNQKAAKTMLDADVEWRKQAQPERITQDQVKTVLACGDWRLLGNADDTGYPVVWIQLSLWDPNAYNVESYGQHACYWLEHLSRIGERFVVMFDLAGWKLSHALHLRKVHTLVQTLQDHYPERLQAALLLRAPMIFSSAWALIKPVIDPVTAAKVAFVSKKDEIDTCKKYHIPLGLLPQAYGGEASGPFPYPNLPGEPTVGGGEKPVEVL